MPRRNMNDLNSPSSRGRARAPDTYTPSPTHTVYSAQREETRHTPGYADPNPETAGTTGPDGQSGAGGQRAQQRLDPEQDPRPSHHTDYTDRTTNRTTSTTLCPRTPSHDRTEYSARNTDLCSTPQHEAQHHGDRDNAPGPEPQTKALVTETTQPSAAEDHTHEALLSVSSGTSDTAMETYSQLSTPPEGPNPPLESLPYGLDISANQYPMNLDNDQLRDSIHRVLQVAAAAHQRPTWSLYRALNETDQRITGTGENRDPGAYIQELRRDMPNVQQQSPERVVVRGRENLNWSLDEPQRSPARAGGPDLHPRIRRPNASNPRGNSRASRPDPAQLDARPHHRPA